MLTKELKLVSGRTVMLAMPDTYALVASEPTAPNMADIPNTALNDILDLIMYGGFIRSVTPDSDEGKRAAESKRYVLARWELAALCCETPRLVLRGPVNAGDLTPRDLSPIDLNAIFDWFQNGGSDGVPAAEGAEPESGTPANSDGSAVATPAE